MFRIKVGLVIGGVVLALFGVRDLWLNAFASSEPVKVDLAALEGGQALSDNNVEIGPHLAGFPALVYATSDKKDLMGDGNVSYSIYPIVSLPEPDKKTGKRPKADFLPFQIPKVLVKSYKYRKESQLPVDAAVRDSMQGMVINSVESLDSDAKDLIKQTYPALNFDHVVIIEEGRKPTIVYGALMLLGGVGMVGAGAAMFLLLKT